MAGSGLSGFKRVSVKSDDYQLRSVLQCYATVDLPREKDYSARDSDDRWCVGVQFSIMATLDLRMAIHRWGEKSATKRVLHSVHRDEPVYYVWDSNRGVLCASVGDGLSLWQDMERDEETAEGFA